MAKHVIFWGKGVLACYCAENVTSNVALHPRPSGAL
jgi:hypothetical protein